MGKERESSRSALCPVYLPGGNGSLHNEILDPNISKHLSPMSTRNSLCELTRMNNVLKAQSPILWSGSLRSVFFQNVENKCLVLCT